jgi:4-hydroxybenzoate polyprenyltransferase
MGGALLNPSFGYVLITYLLLTICYSLYLKPIALLDVLVLATLFTLRIVAGMTLVKEPPSYWLLMFSIFFFFSIALMKREVELSAVESSVDRVHQARGYKLEDRTLLTCFGSASGVASLVVFALFVSSLVEDSSASYPSPTLLWGSLFVLSYWLMRMWLLTVRGCMNEDPLLYAARDRASLLLGALTAAFVFAAQIIPI